jgi:hypothetical protein
MFNDPELNTKFLGKVSADFVKVSDHLKEASYQIRKRGISDYPIFVVCDVQQPIGNLLIDAFQFENSWFYYASFIDEFSQRLIIEPNKIENFVETYREPDEYCCLFVVNEEFTNFIYIPYPID